jgi:hypothetical protein
MRRGRPHPALTDYRLCKEFGWTVEELERQPSKKIQEFLIILAEIDRLTQEEIDRARRESGSQRGFRG